MQTKVSIICTCFNHEKYISQALDSFLMQKTNFKYEIIVYDDMSKDNSRKIIEEYRIQHPHVIKTIFPNENQKSQGINIIDEFIVHYLEGKYVAICEGDDYWIDENKLQKQYDFLETHNDYSSCVHNTRLYNCNKNKFEGNISSLNVSREILLEEIVMNDFSKIKIHTSSFFMRSEYYIKRPYFFYLTPGVGDYPQKINLTLNSRMMYFKENMSVYRIFSGKSAWSTQNKTKSKIIQNYENILKMLENIMENVESNKIHIFYKVYLITKLEIYLYKGYYNKIRKEPIKKIYDQSSFIKKIKYLLKFLYIKFFIK